MLCLLIRSMQCTVVLINWAPCVSPMSISYHTHAHSYVGRSLTTQTTGSCSVILYIIGTHTMGGFVCVCAYNLLVLVHKNVYLECFTVSFIYRWVGLPICCAYSVGFYWRNYCVVCLLPWGSHVWCLLVVWVTQKSPVLSVLYICWTRWGS